MKYFTWQNIEKILQGEILSNEDYLDLYLNAPLSELMASAHLLRKELHPGNEVTYIIDRNINYTNVCLSACRFCNFYRIERSQEAYITSREEYREKIKELLEAGGDQILLQGGLHPKLGLEFYKNLFSSLKQDFPMLKLHALGPAEIVHISRLEGLTFSQTLSGLIDSGLDSLPGAGAEILVDRVRQLVSPAKCSADQWLEVMHEAHKLHLLTSATMMFGHLETPAERVEHILRIREIQQARPEGSTGFISFIPWPFAYHGTVLQQKNEIRAITPLEYVRLLAFARLALSGIPNIQASWLTVGYDTASLCLHSGANDLGSIMIEENVVSAAGKNFRLNKNEMVSLIKNAGFKPALRNQKFEILRYE